MPDYTIKTPSGRKLKIRAPDEATAMRGAQEWEAQNAAPAKTEETAAPPVTQAGADMSWADVGTQAVKNLPRSAAQFGIDLVQPIIHPIETGKNILDLAEGGLQHLGSRLGTRKDGAVTPEMQKASAVKNFLVDRYGDLESFKKTLAEDPVGVAGDVSTVLTGGGMAAARAPGIIGKAGRAVKAAGVAVDPLTPTMKAAGKVVKPLIGATTGVGNDVIDIASKASKSGNGPRQALKEGMRNQLPDDYVLTQARDALREMREEKHQRYLQNIAATKANQTPIDMRPIVQKFFDLDKSYQAKGHYTVDARGQKMLQDVSDVLSEWWNDPQLTSAMDMDGLKRRIEALRPAMPSKDENRIITNMIKAVKEQIEAQEPSYKNAMKDYETLSSLETEIERALSLGNNASGDTTTRKLLSALRNNVNTNFGKRRKLLDELDARRPGLKEAIAGTSLHPKMPRGIQGAIAGSAAPAALVAAAKGLIDPTLLAGAGLSSPRLVGETILLGGKVAPARPLLGQAAFQAGRASDERRMNRGMR